MNSDIHDLHVWVADEVAALAARLSSHPALDALRVRVREQDDTIRRLEADLSTARQQLTAAQGDLATAQGDAAAAQGELTTSRGELATMRGALDAVRRELDTARVELAAERESAARARAETARIATQLETASHTGLDAIRAELQQQDELNLRLRAELASGQADLEAVRAHLLAERQRTDDARAEIARMTDEFETTLDELRREQATVVGEQALTYSSLPLDALLTMFNSLRRCTTLPDVLTTLVNGIAREFTRVALFDVRGTHLEGSQQVGFHFEHDISKIVIPLTPESFLGRAITSGRLETFFPSVNSGPAEAVPFGGSPACALAIPVIVQGATVAVIYADDSDNPEFGTGAAQIRAKFAEILQQHAMLVLLRIGLHQKTVGELREFVSLLVDELEYTHTADVEAGKNALERQHELKENLDRSRRIYAQRTNRDGHATAALLDEHLWSVMESRGESTFARDLAMVLGATGTSSRGAVLTMRR